MVEDEERVSRCQWRQANANRRGFIATGNSAIFRAFSTKLGWNRTLAGHGREALSMEPEADVVGVWGGGCNASNKHGDAQDSADGSLNRKGGNARVAASLCIDVVLAHNFLAGPREWDESSGDVQNRVVPGESTRRRKPRRLRLPSSRHETPIPLSPSTLIIWGFSHGAAHPSGTPSWLGIPARQIVALPRPPTCG